MARVLGGGGEIVRTDAPGNQGQISLGGGSQSFLAARASRQSVFLGNTSTANPMYIALDTGAVIGSGILLPPMTTIELRGFTGALRVRGTAADILAYAEF